MKRTIAIALTVMILAAVLTACSGTASYDDGYGYGNVSTTSDGTVNGTNSYGSASRGYNGTGYGGYGAGGMTGYAGTAGSSYGTGTGMAGGQ